MKWIGQHIVDLIARFRSDVYLEDLATTTEANVLVVDADGKISKNTSVAGDLTSIVAGTGLSGTDLTGPIPTLNVDASQTQITQVGTLASLQVDNIVIDANLILSVGDMNFQPLGGDFIVNSQNVAFTSSTNNKPVVKIESTTTSTGPGELSFVKNKGTGGLDNDDIGTITFVSDNSTEEQTDFASITGEVSESLNTDEAGRLVFKVAESNGTESQLTTGLLIEGEHATDGQVDVTIAAGAASTTTIAGTLTMGSTATLDNSGNLLTNAATATAATNLTASTSTAVQLGTIELGHASDTTIARSASGTATIEGVEIQTLKKHTHITNFGVNLGFAFSRYLPIGSYYILERNTDADPEYTTFVAPYDGKLIKTVLRSEEVLGNTSLTWYKVGDGTEEPDQGSTVDTKTVDVAAAATSYTYTYDSDATFSKGDAIACKIDPTDDPTAAGVVGTNIWEFDLTT